MHKWMTKQLTYPHLLFNSLRKFKEVSVNMSIHGVYAWRLRAMAMSIDIYGVCVVARWSSCVVDDDLP